MANFDLWHKLCHERQALQEQERTDVLKRLFHALDHLADQYEWEDLYIFGSVLKSNQFGQHSDVDIAIKGLNKFLHYQFIANLSSMIDRNVDVIRLEDECLFKDNIIEVGIKWKKNV